MRHDTRLRRAVLETLESRQLLSTYYVSTDGDDANDGSETSPWRSIQKAADSVIAGDVVEVLPGDYDGFTLGMNRPARGTADKPIVFNGLRITRFGDGIQENRATIATPSAGTPDGIYIAPGSTHVVLNGFGVRNTEGAMRAGIRVKQADHITLRRNGVWGLGAFGISAVRADGLGLFKNQIGGGWTRGMSVVGGRDAVIHRNSISTFYLVDTRFRFGIDLQADPSTDEFVVNALVRGNWIIRGATNGAAINAAGVRVSRFVNNVLKENRGAGLAIGTAPGVGDSLDNEIVNNTIYHDGADGWALSLTGHTTGTVVLNNILLNRRDTGGSVLVSSDSREELVVDYNVYDNRFSTDGGEVVVSLKAWRNRIGQDTHSFVAMAEDLFMSRFSSSPHGRSPVVNAGTASYAPKSDVRGRDRIGSPDIGAIEAGYSDSFNVYGIDDNGEIEGSVYDKLVREHYYPLRLTPTFLETFVDVAGTPESPFLGANWEVLPWHSDDDGVADLVSAIPMLYLRGALVRSTATVTGAVEAYLSSGGLDDSVTTAATRVFGVGNAFGRVSGNYWAAFVLRGADNILYAELNLGGTLQQVDLGPQLHDYGLFTSSDFNGNFRVEPTGAGFRFYRDNVLVASLDGVFPDTVAPKILVGSHHESSEMFVDYIEAGPYASGGSYTSVVHDERVSGTWGRLVIRLDMPQLHNTSLLFETRTGETASVDDSWSAWETLGTDDMIQSPNGRYIQVRVTLITTNSQRTPLFYGYQIDARPAA